MFWPGEAPTKTEEGVEGTTEIDCTYCRTGRTEVQFVPPSVLAKMPPALANTTCGLLGSTATASATSVTEVAFQVIPPSRLTTTPFFVAAYTAAGLATRFRVDIARGKSASFVHVSPESDVL